MPVIALTLEYDGTDFVGWQFQSNGVSVQEIVEEALAKLAGHPVRVSAAGRTDSGVHAAGQVVSFPAPARALPLTAYVKGMNGLLPESVAVISAEEKPDDFDARHSATGKRYRYTIVNEPGRRPLTRLEAWQLFRPLDVAAMARAAAPLVGRHDFASFCAANDQSQHSVREVRELVVRGEPGGVITVEIEATAYLKQMVRTIVGTLVEVGQGKRAADDVTRVLAARDRTQAGPTAPPQGLCLLSVSYGPRERRQSSTPPASDSLT